jgi:hypothetical protein
MDGVTSEENPRLATDLSGTSAVPTVHSRRPYRASGRSDVSERVDEMLDGFDP